MNYEEIIKKSQEAYDRFFNDLQYTPSDTEIDDIEIDIQNMQDRIAQKAEQAENHMKYLRELKQEIETLAKSYEESYFPEEHKVVSQKIDKMYVEYAQAQENLQTFQKKLQERLNK